MYAYIKGTLSQLFPTHVVVETCGIGYEIQTPNSYRFQKYLEKEVQIYTSLIVREDAQLLYGFINEEEKEMFLSLIKVTGIGPKSALAILASSTPHEVKLAIENENDAYLTQFPGVGKKTAQQIVLDLKGKLDDLALSAGMTVETVPTTDNQALADALAALESLGYSAKDVAKLQTVLANQKDTTDGYIRSALKFLVK